MAITANASVSRGDIASVAATTVITKPAGTNSTDVLVIIFGDDTSTSPVNSVSAPSGWNAIFTAFSNTTKITLSGFWALGSVSNLTFTNSKSGSSYQQGWVCVGFLGVDNVTPIDATGTTSTSTSSGTVTANAVTPVTTGAVELIGVCSWNGGTWSATGFTDRQNVASPPATNADATLLYNLTALTSGVSTGTVVCTTSAGASGQFCCAAPFALRPSSGSFTWQQLDWGDALLPSRGRSIAIPY